MKTPREKGERVRRCALCNSTLASFGLRRRRTHAQIINVPPGLQREASANAHHVHSVGHGRACRAKPRFSKICLEPRDFTSKWPRRRTFFARNAAGSGRSEKSRTGPVPADASRLVL